MGHEGQSAEIAGAWGPHWCKFREDRGAEVSCWAPTECVGPGAPAREALVSPEFEKLLMPQWGLFLVGGGKVHWGTLASEG